MIYLFYMAKKKHGPIPGTQYKNIRRTKLGSNIAAARRLRGISQETLAEKTGISSRMISYYERESENIPANKLLKIAEALKVTTDQLLNETPDTTNLETSRALLKRIETLKQLPNVKQKVILDMIDQLSGKKTAAE
jgi:transcriptional regulator with XRE-family HTH domain